jgi:hypothetical protein
MASEFGDRERFFIVTAGRTGSSLLASILAAAGADFGMPADQNWDESEGGSFEHPSIVRAASAFRAAFELSPTKPQSIYSRLRWTLTRHGGKAHLRRALRSARFFKAVSLDLVIPVVIKLGYFPRLIVNHRSFAEHALSFSQMFPHRSIGVLEADFLRTYRNALMQLHLYGGCVVGYDELIDPSRQDWVAPLAALTGLEAAHLLAARQGRGGRAGTAQHPLPGFSDQAEQICSSIAAMAGQTIPPSRHALRNWLRQAQSPVVRLKTPSVAQ